MESKDPSCDPLIRRDSLRMNGQQLQPFLLIFSLDCSLQVNTFLSGSRACLVSRAIVWSCIIVPRRCTSRCMQNEVAEREAVMTSYEWYSSIHKSIFKMLYVLKRTIHTLFSFFFSVTDLYKAMPAYLRSEHYKNIHTYIAPPAG